MLCSPGKKIAVVSDGRSIEVPIRHGRFQVPPDALEKEEVEIGMRVGQEKIRLRVRSNKLTESIWTLFVADRRYNNKDLDWMIPKD